MLVPGTTGDLTIEKNYAGGLLLSWNVPYDDFNNTTSGAAAHYDIRFTDAVDYPGNMTSVNFDNNWDNPTWGGKELRNVAFEPAPIAQNEAGDQRQYFTPSCSRLATTLTADITAGATTIPVNATAGFVDMDGTIKIEAENESGSDFEILVYTDKTPTQFNLAGTTAMAHLTGDAVTLDVEGCLQTGDVEDRVMPNTLYYFSLKSKDERTESAENCQGSVLNCSAASNVPGFDNPTGSKNSHTALKYGWNPFSLPYDWTKSNPPVCSAGNSSSLAALFGDDVVTGPSIYEWDAVAQGFVRVPETTTLDSMTNGQGYYILSYGYNYVLDERDSGDTTLVCENPASIPPIQLYYDTANNQPGWNLIGNPWLKNLDVNDINQVKLCDNAGCTGTPDVNVRSFQHAAENAPAWVDPAIFYGNFQTGSLEFEVCGGPPGCEAKLRPWWGHWIKVLDTAPGYA
jgi:hypothetical protein